MAGPVVSRILAKLDGVKALSHGWVARCPVPSHQDRVQSLQISERPDGSCGLWCHAGCPTPTILATIGLQFTDLFAPSNGNGTHRSLLKTYDYRALDGALVYQVCRFEPKEFRQRRPNGSGGWIWNLHGVKRVPYRLPELVGQSQILIGEGEKDVDRLWSLGIPATTNSGGAGKWQAGETRALSQAGVAEAVILPDNDEPGLAHAQQVAAALRAAGIQVRVITLPDLPRHGDVSDWLAAGHTATDLMALIERTPIYTAPAPDPAPAAVAVWQWLADVPRQHVEWIWSSRLARGSLTLWIGDGGMGKSRLSNDVAARITTGAPWPDGSGPAPLGTVVILSAEDNAAYTIRPAIEAAGGDLARVAILEAIRDASGAERTFQLASDLSALEALIEATGAEQLVVDPVSAYFGTKLDSYRDTDVRAVLEPLVRLAERRHLAVLGIMHISKASDRLARHRALGSVAFVNAARLVFAIGPDPEDGDRRLLVPVKANLCREAPALAFRLVDAGAWRAPSGSPRRTRT